jgi:hypothetical protein
VIFSLLEAVLYGSVQSVQFVQQGEEGTKIEAGFGMVFKVVLRVFLAMVIPSNKERILITVDWS